MTPILPRLTMTAVAAVVEIARHTGMRPLPSATLHERLQTSPRYLETALQRLVAAGVLKGVRGPAGGYVVGRNPHNIRVGEIARLVDADSDNPSPSPARAMLEPPLAHASAYVERALDALTIGALICPTDPRP